MPHLFAKQMLLECMEMKFRQRHSDGGSLHILERLEGANLAESRCGTVVVRFFLPRSLVSAGAFQPHLAPIQHVPISDPARYRFQQLGMGDAPEMK